MPRSALVGFWRSLVRHRLYAALNIGGLAVGIAVFVILSIYVRFETGYDKFLPGWRNIHLIESANVPVDANGFAQGAPTALWTAVRRDLPEIVGTRTLERSATVVHGNSGTSETFALVDPTFPEVFRLHAVSGDYAGALRDPTALVLTARTARKYLGTVDAIGRTLSVKVQGVARSYRLAAVIPDWPANSDVTFDMLAPLVVTDDPNSPDYNEENGWEWWSAKTYVVLPTAASVARFEENLKGVVERHAQTDTPDSPGFKIQHRLRPIASLHFEAPGKALAVATLALVALLTLLVAIMNYVNLATARAGLRAREVAMRKVLGADRATIIRHYLVESVATTAIAAALGASAAEIGMPFLNAMTGLDLKLRYFGADGIALPLVVLTMLCGLLAGLYPAIVLSRLSPAMVLASSRSPGGGRMGARVREGLVVLQFGIAIAFLVSTLVMSAQVRHVRNADAGYRRDGLMLVPSLARSDLDVGARNTIMHRLAALPQVASTTIADLVPGPAVFHANAFLARPDRAGSRVTFSQGNVAPRYFETLGSVLVAGRLFDPSRPADQDANYRPDFAPSTSSKPINIVINRAGARALGFADPAAAIGRDVSATGDPQQTIIGVVEDMRFGGSHAPIAPTVYHFVLDPPGFGIGVIRYSGETATMLQSVRSVWRQSAPSVPFDALTATRNLDTYNRSDDRTARLFTTGALLAVLIGSVGLWGLASFNTARRVREIGIRKTLGASSGDVARLLVGQFLRPVLIANLFAWPLAFAAMRTWLAGFDDPIPLSPVFFVAAAAAALAVALLTVLAQSLRASRATPAWALRHE